MQLARAAWRSRGFIIGSLRREFTARYKGSLLGAAWAAINPLAMVVVYLVVFSQLMRARLPGGEGGVLDYGVYLCAGILTWGLFTEIVQKSTTMFLDNAGLIKKMNFPRICLPVIAVLSASMNFLISYALFVMLLVLTGYFPGMHLLAIVPLILIVAAIGAGLGTIIGVLNVFFRDVGQVVGVLLQLWFWLTPIVYPVSILPPAIAPFIAANPLTPLIAAQQDVALGAGWPDWSSVVAPLAFAAVVMGLALLLFRRRAHEIVDEL
jgi:lipopolysaccharide transport system permease protein